MHSDAQCIKQRETQTKQFSRNAGDFTEGVGGGTMHHANKSSSYGFVARSMTTGYA